MNNKNQAEFVENANTQSKYIKKKKPFFLRWWFILLVIIVGLFLFVDPSSGDEIVWDDIVLGDMLPEPPNDEGNIFTNDKDELCIYVDEVSSKEFDDYLESCKKKGFEIDANYISSSYTAYNSKGYKLHLSHYGNNGDMKIEVFSPMEMEEITWPTSTAGKKIPQPKSTIGNFSYEREDEFLVYIGNTTKDDYEKYIDSCSKKGFNVDYEKGDNYYTADDKEGWQVNISYQGNNIMKIEISVPSAETTETSEPETTDTNGLDPEFKEAMDSYEEFMDEYVKVVKKYADNPNDPDVLADYTDYMQKYAEFVKEFEDWEDTEMNSEEAAYYVEVQGRVSKKLLEIAQ